MKPIAAASSDCQRNMKLAPDDRNVARIAREMMEQQLTQMGRLNDDLLDLSRVGRGIDVRRRSRLRSRLRWGMQSRRTVHWASNLVMR